jgi:hypothetical protein
MIMKLKAEARAKGAVEPVKKKTYRPSIPLVKYGTHGIKEHIFHLSH